MIASIGCRWRWRHFCSFVRHFIRRWRRIKAVNFFLSAHNRGFGGARCWQSIGRGVEKVFRWFDMVIVVQKWIFDVEKGDISTMFDLGELKICTNSQRLYARKLPSKKISWRKKYGGVKNSKSVSTEDYSVIDWYRIVRYDQTFWLWFG